MKFPFRLFLLLNILFFILVSVISWQISLQKKLSLEKTNQSMCLESLEKEISDIRNNNYSQVILRPKLKENDENSAFVCFPHISEFVSNHKGKILGLNIYRNGELLKDNLKNKTFFIDKNLPPDSIDYTLSYILENNEIFTSEPETLRPPQPARPEVIYGTSLVKLIGQKIKLSDTKEEQTVIQMLQKTLEQLEYVVLDPSIKQKGLESVQLKLKQNAYEIIVKLNDGSTYKQETLTGPFVHVRFGSPFSGNAYFWDEAIVSWYFLKLFPTISRSTLDFWYDLQIQEGTNKGLIPRELKTENLYKLKNSPSLLQQNINPISYIPLSSLQVSNPFFLSKIELELYELYGDKGRLRDVYPELESYFWWVENNRKKIDQTTNCPYYEFSNLGSGMDNIMRGFGEFNPKLTGYGWMDLFAQQVFLAQDLETIQRILNVDSKLDIPVETLLHDFIRCHFDPEGRLFWDRSYKSGFVKQPNSIAFVWTLFIDFRTENDFYKKPIAGYLSDPEKFGGYPGIPSVARDDPLFHKDGNYWQGGVWPPMNWIAIKGLEYANNLELKSEITQNTLQLVIDVFEDRGTVFEYYSPTLKKGQSSPGVFYRGNEAIANFYGWGAIAAALLLR